MTNLYDPDGQLAEYRRRRVRNDNYKALLFAIGFVCAVVGAACLYLLIDLKAAR